RRGAARPAPPVGRRPRRPGRHDRTIRDARGDPRRDHARLRRRRAYRGAAERDSGAPRVDARGGQRRGTDRPGAHQGEDSRGPAAVVSETFGPPAARAAGGDGDLTLAGSAASRRVSEFLGVALFASAVITLLALASYSPSDPVWFFNTGSDLPPGNFVGRI